MDPFLEKLAPAGRIFFATSLGAFGILQFRYGDFVPGRATEWPASVPGRLAFAYLTGMALVAAAAAILAGRKARWAAVISGTMVFVWALLRHIPLAAADPHYGGAWTNLGKALALFGGAFAVAGSLPAEKVAGPAAAIVNPRDPFVLLGRVCLGAFLVSSGIQHFLFVPFVATLVPAWAPGGALFWTYCAGVLLIAGGAGMLLPPTAQLAAALSGLMIFLWFLTLHIPRALAAPPVQLRNEWTAVFEALAMSGIALVLAGTATGRRRRATR